MKQTLKNLYRPTIAQAICAVCVMIFASAASAAVVERATSAAASARPTVSRGQAISSAASVRVPTTTSAATTTTNTTATLPATTPTQVATPTTTTAPAQDFTIENKSTRFDGSVAEASTSSNDSTVDSLADLIARQRAALDSAPITAGAAITSVDTYGGNACDANLRACMQSKCGKDYSKCKGDTDTLWGTKMDACRRDLTCTGEEYRVFAAEIKADRDMNARLASYNSIIECGNEYNDCIMTQCGTDYNKCLGKTAGDAAISACDKIAKNCVQQDSGLAARTMNVFGTLRQTAEVQIQKDEQRLYDLRDQMRSVCARLGALFDERSLDCVYTVEFYADAGSTLYASKKVYAGDTFDCTQNWFGVDITTFKENAYRYTRQATSATSGMLGAGLGMAVGAVTSGMVNRAIDSQKAKRDLKKAEKEDENNPNVTGRDTTGQTGDKKDDGADKLPDPTKQTEKDMKTLEKSQEIKVSDSDLDLSPVDIGGNSADAGAGRSIVQQADFYVASDGK